LLSEVLNNVDKRGAGEKWGNRTPDAMEAILGRFREGKKKPPEKGGFRL